VPEVLLDLLPDARRVSVVGHIGLDDHRAGEILDRIIVGRGLGEWDLERDALADLPQPIGDGFYRLRVRGDG
jgi:hypothetical protein